MGLNKTINTIEFSILGPEFKGSRQAYIINSSVGSGNSHVRADLTHVPMGLSKWDALAHPEVTATAKFWVKGLTKSKSGYSNENVSLKGGSITEWGAGLTSFSMRGAPMAELSHFRDYTFPGYTVRCYSGRGAYSHPGVELIKAEDGAEISSTKKTALLLLVRRLAEEHPVPVMSAGGMVDSHDMQFAEFEGLCKGCESVQSQYPDSEALEAELSRIVKQEKHALTEQAGTKSRQALSSR